MKKTFLVFLAFLLATSVTPADAAVPGLFKSKKKGNVTPSDTTKVETDYDKFLKKKPVSKVGFITLHQAEDKLWCEMPVEMMDRQMLFASTLSEISDNGLGIVGYKTNDPLLVSFRKVGKKVTLNLHENEYVTREQDTTIAAALKINGIGSVLAAFDVKTYNNDSTAVVFDMTDFFIGDVRKLRPLDDRSGSTSVTVMHKSKESFILSCKAFETNVTVRTSMTYSVNATVKGQEVLKGEPMTAVMTHTLLLLDEQPWKPRPVDSRIAIFPTTKILFDGAKQASENICYANRWRMEPKDTAAFLRGEKVDPVKPIIFYIDPAFPVEWKDAIFEAVNQWQEPFERIGFSNAIMAKPYPTDDPEFDPDNLKYSCIRYVPTTVENAMGPSWTDPRSGEIINASVFVYHDVVKLINNWRFIQTAQTDASVRSGKLPKEVFEDAMRYVITHEVGHCLGLMHNMSSSATIPVDSLRSPSFTQKYGTTHSIMDYARFNYVAQPGDMEKGVKLTPPRFGLYDYFTIHYSYAPLFDVKTYEEEKEIVFGWIKEAIADPVYRYGHQQMRSIIDPRSQNEDLGDNSVTASEYGTKNLKYILPKVSSWVVDDNDCTYKREIYTGIIEQYLTYVKHVYANIGGIYLYEKLDGDPIENAYSPVPVERQKEAFDWLVKQFNDTAWLDEPTLMEVMPIIGSPAKAMKVALAEAIVKTPAKIMTHEQVYSKDKVWKLEDCCAEVYDLVWKPTIQGRKLTADQMMLQREFVKTWFAAAGYTKYSGAGAGPKADSKGITTPDFLKDYEARNARLLNDTPNPDRQVVYGYSDPYYFFVGNLVYNHEFYDTLLKVQKLLKSRVGSASGETKAHYELLLHNIQKTIDK
ncbi:MAG: zinc-dependent metalloprotease [Bacteroidales bacterium]|nr:zinc-dependent metalloprotease [Bacteroidales bacterium]